MRILIDTNILIYREDDHVLSKDMQKLLATIQKIGADLLIHPLSLADLKKDVDKERREIMLSKIRTYPFLDRPPNPKIDLEYLNTVKSEIEDNEAIDNNILYAVYKDAVDFLVTEDRGIHKKARRLGIDDRVLLINDALQILDQYMYKERIITPLALREEYVYNLNLRDPIFDSLKKDYKEFDEWFRKISREGRKCLVHFREDGGIGALLIYKIEDEPINSNPPLAKKKRLKIATFKVTYVGHNLGELFIKLSTDISIKNGISEIYLTHFREPETDRLMELISEYGFYKAAVNQRGEDIFVKKLVADADETIKLSPLEIAKKFYPSFYDGVVVRKFIVPIRPAYHNRLFTTFEGRQTTLSEYAGDFIVEGNTIKKAYICHSRTKRMHGGDILLFYLSGWQQITSIGIVEAIYTGIQGSNDILRRVGKRTVYSKDEIEEIAKRPCMVILFGHHFHLANPLLLSQLQTMRVFTHPPQSIMQIADENYLKIKMKGGIDERFTVH